MCGRPIAPFTTGDKNTELFPGVWKKKVWRDLSCETIHLPPLLLTCAVFHLPDASLARFEQRIVRAP